MRDVIHHMHVQVIWLLAELLGKGLPAEEGHGGAVHPGIVSCGCHRCQVVLSLLHHTAEEGAGEDRSSRRQTG